MVSLAVSPADAAVRYAPPARWILGPLYGTGCPSFGACENPFAPTTESEVAYQLTQLSLHDIPVTGYHFDGPSWSTGECTWGLGDALVARLRLADVRALVHVWGGCQDEVDAAKLARHLGTVFGGLYLDEGSTDGTARAAMDSLRESSETTSEVVMKAFSWDGLQTLSGLAQLGHTAYVNDLPADFPGLRTGIERVFEMASILPAPFNELTGYDGENAPDEEAFFRRLHWGALQVVMDHSPWRNADPWSHGYSPALLQAYRRYAWLHWQLIPYLHSYDYAAYETGRPILRSPDPAEYTVLLGDELFVAYVVTPGVDERRVRLPPGEWIDFWDETRVLSGSVVQPAPLGREPLFIRGGAIIPMQVRRDYTGHGSEASDGSLTVLVYPQAASHFRYRDENEYWVELTARQEADTLRLQASPPPSIPILYRVGRWYVEPDGVRVDADAVVIGDGGTLPRLADADAVARSAVSAWCYDAVAARVVVKVVR
jgi:hypothetical protein